MRDPKGVSSLPSSDPRYGAVGEKYVIRFRDGKKRRERYLFL